MRYHESAWDGAILPPRLPSRYSATQPPCNEIFLTIAAIAVSAAISIDSANTQAKQAEYNAEAQTKAITLEQQREAADEEENRRRAIVEQRRFRAQQLTSMASSGALLGTGSALDIEADTWAKQQVELADRQRVFELGQRQLAYQALSTTQLGEQQAAMYRREGTGAAISGIARGAASGYSAWSSRPQTATAYNRNTRQPMAGSTNV